MTLYDEMLQWQTMIERLKADAEARQAMLEDNKKALEKSEIQLAESQTQLAESQKLQELNVLLAKQGRIDDLIAAAEDVECRQKLLKEFGL